MSHLEGRILQVEDWIARAEVIDIAKVKGDRVVFGATVELEEMESAAKVVYRIVGEFEADIKKGLLSVTSPIARAMIGREVGDAVKVQAPGGLREYEIADVRFEDEPEPPAG